MNSSTGDRSSRRRSRAPSGPTRSAVPRRLTGWRRWLFPVLATALSIVALGAVEVGLRVGGVGYPASFFVPARQSNGVLLTNPRFGWRFFPRPLARTPIVTALPVRKTSRTFRLFVFGESAAMGTPDPAFSFARVLEVMLSEAFPDLRVEVVNTAMTAINSHVIRLIVSEAVGLRPDLLLFYMGNNEVVGPYGPATVFGRVGSALPLVRGDIWLRGTRTGQLLARGLGWARPGSPPLFEWRGLEMFAAQRVAADDPRLAATYGHFRRNLQDMVDRGRRARVPLVLVTVATNLADHPPFASMFRPGLGETDRQRWATLVQQASERLDAGRPGEALDALGAALRIDDRPAALHFLLGRAYRALGRREAALEAFVRARDLDALRFRADSTVNETIRQAAAGAEGVVDLVDFERHLIDQVGGPPGESTFWDHVHFTFEGNYRLARALFPVVARHVAGRVGVRPRGDPLSMEACADRLALTDWDRARVAMAALELVRRPPFTEQIDHAKRLARRRAEAMAWQRRAAAALDRVEQQYRRVLAQRPHDWLLRANFATLLRERGKWREATAEWRRLVEAAPEIDEWRVQLAIALADEAASYEPPDRALQSEARSILERLVREQPDLPAGHLNLGNVLRQMGDPAGALARYRAALRLNPGYELARLNLAGLLAERGDAREAIHILREGLALDPQSVELRARLAVLVDQQGELDGAIEEYRRVLEVDPEEARVRNRLAYALERTGRFEEALAEYRRAAESDPTFVLAYLNLADLLLRVGRASEAVATWRRALAVEPDSVVALNNLAWVLATASDRRIRRPAEAVRLAERARSLAGDSPEGWRTLAAAYAATGRPAEAVRAATRALELARRRADERLAALIEAELRAYGQGARP